MTWLAAFALWSSLSYAKNAEQIWYNGSILTMNDAQPSAQAIAVTQGKIIAVGNQQEVMKLKNKKTRLTDLKGATLLPGFVDPHSHVSGVGLQAASANLLPPPDGANSSIADIQKTLTDYIKSSENSKKYGGLVMGFGYDDSQLAEKRHPRRDELDSVSSTLPIVIMHQSGHIGVMNSKALELAGITSSSPNPSGGIIVRKANSQEPSGVLQENAYFLALLKVMPTLTEEQSLAMLEEGQKLYLKYGYTTIQDGRSSPDQLKTFIAASKKKRLLADIVSYPDILMTGTDKLLKPPYYHNISRTPQYQNHFRLGGVKVTLDGSPQGKTAWLTKPYYIPPEGEKKDYAGYGVVDDAKLIQVYEQALSNRWQILTHSNGDRATDQMITAMEAAQKKFPHVEVRPVLIHGQVLRKDQVAKIKALGIIPSLFPMHTFYWGDWHRTSVLGPERAENISPTGWVLEQKMIFTTHHDAPVVLPDSMRILSATVTRKTRSGYTLGKEHKVDVLTALKAMTLWSAYQHWEEKSKGSLENGKLADFVILAKNPLQVPESELEKIQVLETIKEGKTIYKVP
ncbi:amidohydrolase [Bdellovibrio bacteriovorus]|uniref:amidohydrolase n=1 Tax=Bdellovibrio bacteriovorus TaxID=959 RepID=UPI0035A7152C